MTVRAAGGVVWRSVEGGVEVLIVHRPRYDDWSLPKGKLDPSDASELACAVREVFEETGYHAEPTEEIATTSYEDRAGQRKSVRYWSMTVRGGEFAPNSEVDAVMWVGRDGLARLTYERDHDIARSVLDAVSARLSGH